MCVPRADGAEFDVDAFLLGSTPSACKIYRRGEPRLKGARAAKRWEVSGINVAVSDASWSDLTAPVADAERFLCEHHQEITRLRTFPGVDGLVLDFPIASRIGKDAGAQCERFPAALVAAAGALGLDLELSLYAVCEPNET